MTIKDVALHAGVGIGTVSRAINQADGISPETRKKVLKSIKELEYIPNNVAQSMRSQKYNNIVLFADITNHVFAEIAKEAQIELDKYGYTLSLCSIDEKDPGGKILSFLEGRRFDGIILSIPTEDDLKLNETLSQIDIPIVTLNRDLPNLPPGIITDYYSSVKDATKYLLSLGHENIALIVGNKGIRPTREGMKAYSDAYREFNKDVNNNLIKSGKFSSASGKKLFLEMLPNIRSGKITAMYDVTLLHSIISTAFTL